MTTATQDSDHGTLDQDTVDRDALSEQELLVRGWDALPASYRIPEVAPTLDEARAWCRRLAESHYENFHVASWFLPPALRRRGWLHGLGPRPAQPLGPRTRRLLPGPRAPSGLCGPG